MDVATPLTGTLAVAIDSLPSKDTELAVVERRGVTAHSIDQYFDTQHVLFLQARWSLRVTVFIRELIAAAHEREYCSQPALWIS